MDASGQSIDTTVDVAFIAYAVYGSVKNRYTSDWGIVLAADVMGSLMPGMTGTGAVNATVQAANRADVASDLAKAAKAEHCGSPPSAWAVRAKQLSGHHARRDADGRCPDCATPHR